MRQHPNYDIWRLLDCPDHEAEVRALCQTAYLGDHEALCRVLGRYKIYVDTRDIGIASHLMLEGYWEMWVTQAMMRMVRRGSVVADIGANLGYFTLLLADLTAEWKERGSVELVQVASGYRFQTRPEMQVHIDRMTPEKPLASRWRHICSETPSLGSVPPARRALNRPFNAAADRKLAISPVTPAT